MKDTRLVALVTAGTVAVGMWLASGAPASAHHSFAATYNLASTEQIKGRVVQLLIRNPHSFIHVQATDTNGQVQRWSIEGAAASSMQREKGEGLQVGDEVQVRFNPARSRDSYRGRLVSIVRPSDGWSWGTRAGEVVD
jgi:hypothetical protein